MQSPSSSKLAGISPAKLSYKDDLRLKGFKELLYMIRNADPASIQSPVYTSQLKSTLDEALEFNKVNQNNSSWRKDGVGLSDQQKSLLANLDHVGSEQLSSQYQVYKKMYEDQKKLQDLFTSKIRNKSNRITTVRMRESVSDQVKQFHRGMASVPEHRRSQQLEPLHTLINICNKLQEEDELQGGGQHIEDKSNLQTDKYEKSGNDRNLINGRSDLIFNRKEMPNSSQQQLAQINSGRGRQQVMSRNSQGDLKSYTVSTSTRKPAFRIKSKNESQIVLKQFQNSHIKARTWEEPGQLSPDQEKGVEESQLKKQEYRKLWTAPLSPKGNQFISVQNKNQMIPLQTMYLNKQSQLSSKKSQKDFQKHFLNHQNSVIRIINNTFKKVKTSKQDEDVKNKVRSMREEDRAKRELVKLQQELKGEIQKGNYDGINMPLHFIEEFNTSKITPMFTISQPANQRHIFSQQSNSRMNQCASQQILNIPKKQDQNLKFDMQAQRSSIVSNNDNEPRPLTTKYNKESLKQRIMSTSRPGTTVAELRQQKQVKILVSRQGQKHPYTPYRKPSTSDVSYQRSMDKVSLMGLLEQQLPHKYRQNNPKQLLVELPSLNTS